MPPTDEDFLEIRDRLKTVELRIEGIPGMLEKILARLDEEREENRAARQEAKEHVYKDGEFRTASETRFGGIEKALDKGEKRFLEIEEKVKKIQDNYMPKSAPGKLLIDLGKWAGAIITIGGALAYFGVKVEANTRQAQSTREPQALQMVQSNGTTYMIRVPK